MAYTDSGNHLIQDNQAKFFLAAVIDSLRDSVVTVNLDGVITSWNEAAERLYGYSASEAMGKPLSMVTFPEDFKDLITKIDRIRRGEQIELYKTLRIHKDGHHMQLEITLSPVKDDKGVPIGVSTVARDITELRKAKQALAESENRFRAIVEAALDFAIIMLDDHGKIIGWNSGAELMFGYKREEAIGLHTAIIFTEEDRHADIPMVEIEVAKREGRSFDERWHLRKDGVRFFMSGVMTPIREGDLSGYVKVARDISDRKLAEEALFLSEQRKSLAVQSAQMGEWEWDANDNLIKVSDQVAVLLGLLAGDVTLAPDQLLQRIYPGDEQLVRDQLDAALKGLNIFQCECRIIRADNQQTKWVNMYGRLVRQTAAGPSKVIGVLYDITPRKVLEKQKDDFISVASHELKTPVTAIKVFSELLMEKFASGSDNTSVGIVHTLNGQVERLTKLIKNLLDTSNLSEGQMKLYPQAFDINAAIEEQMDSLRLIAMHHRVVWKPGRIPIIHADRERIMQVVTNFVTNAAKYSPEQTDIVITTEDKLDKLLLSVQDQGTGIPVEAQQFVFERYYRGEHAADNKGFGLGLYICAQIIKHHNGTIGLSSAPGQGATFYFTLPYS